MSTTAPDRVDEFEEALDAPSADRRDPFVHTFRLPWWRCWRDIRPGDVALCGVVAPAGVRTYRAGAAPGPKCPRCERLRRS